MCGIIGYVGSRNACEVIVRALERLEYRGYDSAGIAVVNEKLEVSKVVGRVEKLKSRKFEGTIGVGHTRWSTHGKPSIENAHPHVSCDGKIAVVHNGIIENYLELKEELKTHSFKSETDTEVIAHLIEENYSGNLKEAVLKAIKKLVGAYALCVVHESKPDEIIAVRSGSPLALGIGVGENFVASDVSAFIEHTKKTVYLNERELAVVKKNGVELFDSEGKKKQLAIVEVNWDLEQAQKSGFKHFMLKEIFEQPRTVEETSKIKINAELKADKIFITACGTASYAGLVGKYVIERLARVPTEWVLASEFRYSNPIVGRKDLLVVISQSGETADTLAALRLAKEKGARTLAIVNVVDSTIAREADDVVYTRAGLEIGVASTKAFTSQLVALYKIAEKMSGKKMDLSGIPKAIEKILAKDKEITEIARKYFKVYNFLFLGRDVNYPIALEGALKMKEISYIHAEGYAAGEMKHGPIALVTDEVPTVAIAVNDEVKTKIISNIQEIKARNGKIIAIATEGDTEIKKHANEVIYVPKTDALLTPLLTVIPLQLLAYHTAELRECDIDKPRNLAKSVTVE
ncbi:glutamine--fructose-6-phosphate transaminase (isomerizing) [Candidatus Micrarchaeota archaeon]|nr:glutamine--fructose-6-phosphate transaminase (isomerizing) [Candidatus Micrarchaeota archaeon]